MKHIAVNTRFLIKDKLEGIGLFTHEVMRRVVQLMHENKFTFFFDRQPSEEFLYEKNVKGIVLSPQARHPFLWYLWFEHAVPNALKKHNADLFFSTDGYLSLKTRTRSVITIHDLAFYHFKEHLPYMVHKYFNYYTPKFAIKADHIVTVSAYSKMDIHERYGVDREKISVVGNGCDEAIRPLSEQEKQKARISYAEEAEYFVYVGAIHPRKNIQNLLLAFDQFKQQFDSHIKLLLVGRWAWKTAATKKTFDQMSYSGDVITLGHLNRQELSLVLGGALGLVYPSFFEGFGIPLLEAMHAEVPIVTSNRSSLPEVAGDAAVLVEPDSIESICQAMIKLAEDIDLREKLIQAGRQQRLNFSWDQTADKVAKILEAQLK